MTGVWFQKRSTLILLLLCGIVTGCTLPLGRLRLIAREPPEQRAISPERRLESLLDTAASSPESAESRAAAGRWLHLWAKHDRRLRGEFGHWEVEIVDRGWSPGYFDELLPAADYDVKGLNQRTLRGGRGIALVGSRENRGATPEERYFPEELITRPVTAVIRKRGPHRLTIELHDPWHDESLAADFTAPVAQLLERAGPLRRSGLGGLLQRVNSGRRHGLYLLQPYDPDKTPVLFVHGLISTPLAWAHLTHDLWADEEFRRSHQIWHYFYPTSAPFLYSARNLRVDLEEAQRMLDPEGRHRASQHVDIVAHSMGGLLSRTLITDSGDRVWDTVFSVPSSSLVVSAEDREMAKEILHWRARPEVRRVIFIATPHRGSRFALNPVSRLAANFAALPTNLTGLYKRIHAENPNALHPYFQRSLPGARLSSIDTLSPAQPTLPILLELPISPKVTLHSIIGERDLIVPYSSSHLDNAASELMVSAGHGAIKPPETRDEVLRILKLDHPARPPQTR